MLAKKQMFEVYANFDFFLWGGGVLVNVWGVRTLRHLPENPPLEKRQLTFLVPSFSVNENMKVSQSSLQTQVEHYINIKWKV